MIDDRLPAQVVRPDNGKWSMVNEAQPVQVVRPDDSSWLALIGH
jgi:hypothetical protein